MKGRYAYCRVLIGLAAMSWYGCAQLQVNGGGTLPSASGNAADKANFGFEGNSCAPGALTGVAGSITGTFNYHDKAAPGWTLGGVKLNGKVFEVGRCADATSGMACKICNVQFCNCPGWPSSLPGCVQAFLADPAGVCGTMTTVPGNLYGIGFSFTSTNPRYPGTGMGVACVTDNGQGKHAIDRDHVLLAIGVGQYQGYVNHGSVRGNVASGACTY